MRYGRILMAPVLAGALVLGACEEEEPEVAAVPAEIAAVPPAVTPATMPEPVAQLPGVSIADILGNPAGFLGQTWTVDAVQVPEVPTDRGFWIEDQGSRLFAIIIDDPEEQPKDINPGQTLRITEGVLRDRTFLPQIPGEPLEAQTQQIAEQQPVFLVVDERNIQILSSGTR